MTAQWLTARADMWEKCDQLITQDAALELLISIADTPAPSGASSITRGEQVELWWSKQGLESSGAQLTSDAYRSGCDLLSLGTGGLRMLAHLDEVSYLLDGPAGSPGLWWVAPYCYHLAEKPAPARAIRFAPDGSWVTVATGEVTMVETRHVFKTPETTELGPADRIVLASDVSVDLKTKRVTGSLDNAAGVASALLAASVLSAMGIPFSLGLTDEEEGPSGASSQTISRGAARLLRHLEDAPLAVAIDIHGVPTEDLTSVQDHDKPWGASLAEFSSHGRGSVAPPQLFAGVKDLLCSLQDHGVNVKQNVGGYVPRSDDVTAMTHSNRVIILGYPGMNRHFDRGLPATNLEDLLHLARALVVLGVAVHSKQLAVDW